MYSHEFLPIFVDNPDEIFNPYFLNEEVSSSSRHRSLAAGE
jgi:hypothetical protein